MGSILEMLRTPETQQALAQILTQIVAFLILLGILKRFAWKPLVGMLDARRKIIADEFKRIEEMEQQVKELREEYEAKLRNIDAEGRARIHEAIKEGRRIAREITDNARVEAQQILERARQGLELEISRARVELRDDIVDMVLITAEKLLRERLDEPKQRELIASFIDDLRKV
ncbi:F0F1 ATP synthase subunit B [Candidatus Sumerlaeota bacterium]|nr:F0F1 ATP synthase subunit B [Candidatus Sumerlaeota bacterium]